MQGKVLKWDYEKRRIEVSSPFGLIFIPEDEITTYPTLKLTSSGIPVEIADLINRRINFIRSSKGCWSRKLVMEKDYNDLKNGSIIQGTVSGFSKSGNTFLHYKSLTLICNLKDLSVSFVKDPQETLSISQKVPLMVLEKKLYDYTQVSYSGAYPDRISNYSAGDIVTCRVSIVREDIKAYFLEVSPSVRGIMDIYRCPELSYGQNVLCRVKKVTPNGLRLAYLSNV